MDIKGKVLIGGAVALMVVGLVMAVNVTQQGGKFPGMGWMRGGGSQRMHQGNQSLMASLGLSDNATREQVSDAMWEKQLKDLGLTDDSTMREYRQALEAKMQAASDERDKQLKEKLNLPANATQEDVQNAMQQWRNDNKNLLEGKGSRPGPGMRGDMGFGKGCTKPTQ